MLISAQVVFFLLNTGLGCKRNRTEEAPPPPTSETMLSISILKQTIALEKNTFLKPASFRTAKGKLSKLCASFSLLQDPSVSGKSGSSKKTQVNAGRRLSVCR